jgi:hypothetical protein
MFDVLSSMMAGVYKVLNDGGISNKQFNVMNQTNKFFSNNIIGFKGLRSFVAVNGSLSMNFLFLKNKACYCYCKDRA